MDTDARYLSRKFVLTAFLLLASLLMLAVDVLTADQWIGLVEWVLGLYMVGNVGAKAVTPTPRAP